MTLVRLDFWTWNEVLKNSGIMNEVLKNWTSDFFYTLTFALKNIGDVSRVET